MIIRALASNGEKYEEKVEDVNVPKEMLTNNWSIDGVLDVKFKPGDGAGVVVRDVKTFIGFSEADNDVVIDLDIDLDKAEEVEE